MKSFLPFVDKHYALCFKIMLCTLLCMSFTQSSFAYSIPAGDRKGSELGLELVDISRQESDIVTSLNMDFSKVNLAGNAELVLTPMYVNGTDTLRMQPVTVAGRNRWYWLQRNNEATGFMVKGFGSDRGTPYAEAMPASSKAAQLTAINTVDKTYNLTLCAPYQPWMEEAVFTVESEMRGCANCLKTKAGEEGWMPLARTDFTTYTFTPEFIYVTPVAEAVKTRDISARAYIDFVVNRIEINPNYRRNPVELGKIRATIDSVRNDKDITITKLHISGTASPEGSYDNNVRLAKGRTAALKDYVQGLYKFPQGLITTSYEPVDWQGLAQFLELTLAIGRDGSGYEQNTQKLDSIRMDQFKAISQFLSEGAGELSNVPNILPHAQQILDIVNGGLEPYARNSKIRTTYPKEYDWLLKNVYPALRHSDYRIEFEIKHFTEAPEIIEVMKTQPSKLSLEELFVAAQSQPEGSELYNEAFDIAVKLYPKDETANLNAGVTAMVNGELNRAERYLANAGNSDEARYNRGVLNLLKGEEAEALAIFESLVNSSNPAVAQKASEAMQGVKYANEKNSRNYVGL